MYWICTLYPTPEVLEAHDLRSPDDFTRSSFRDTVLEAHTHDNVKVVAGSRRTLRRQ